MDSSICWIILIAVVITAVALMIVTSMRLQRKRAEAIDKLAGTLGLSFSADMDALPAQFKNLLRQPGLLSAGYQQKMINFIFGSYGGFEVVSFEFHYEPDDDSPWVFNHIVLVSCSDFTLPEFTIRPEKFIDKANAVLGTQDIDFEDFPGFSKRFVLQGPDEISIRHFLAPRIMHWFEKHPKSHVEAWNKAFIFWQPNHVCRPREIPRFLKRAVQLANQFKRR